jgi:hypothetical protein
MSALYVFACVVLIVALGYIGVSWAVAGAGLCVFATIALAGLLVAKAPRHRLWDYGHQAELRFETGEHGGDYPDNMPQAITVTDAKGRWAVYVPLRVGGKIVVPDSVAH